MANLKIKFKYKSFEIELDGEEATVQSEFATIKQNGLGNVVMGVDLLASFDTNTDVSGPTSGIKQITQGDNFYDSSLEYPTMRNIVLKQLPSSETEWILVYAFYATDYGNKSFLPKDISDQYRDSQRTSKSNIANLSKNIKSLVVKNFFTALNDSEYLLTQEGKDKAIEIINRASSHSKEGSINRSGGNGKTLKLSSKKSPKIKSNKLQIIDSLNFRPEGKTSLGNYIDGYESEKTTDKIILTVKYLKEILEVSPVTLNHIYSCFSELNWKVTDNFKQVVINCKNNSKLLSIASVDNVELSMKGENRIKFYIKK